MEILLGLLVYLVCTMCHVNSQRNSYAAMQGERFFMAAYMNPYESRTAFGTKIKPWHLPYGSQQIFMYNFHRFATEYHDVTNTIMYEPEPHSLYSTCTFSKGFNYEVPAMFRHSSKYVHDMAYKMWMKVMFFNTCLPCFKQKFQGYTLNGRPCQDEFYFPGMRYAYGHRSLREDEWRTQATFACYMHMCIHDFYTYHVPRGHKAYKFAYTIRGDCTSKEDLSEYYIYRSNDVRAFFAVHMFYIFCLSGEEEYCPDPCKKPGICSKDNMKRECIKLSKPNQKQMKLIHPYFSWVRDVFRFSAYCPCKSGYEFDMVSHSCKSIQFTCKDIKDACLNGGSCQLVPPHMSETLARSYTCKCPPAWKGLRCETINDPCVQPSNVESCSPFRCRRSTADPYTGFTCECPLGYFLERTYWRPSCKDINECIMTQPCLNGGKCINTAGSYTCSCIRGFTGTRCQNRPPEPMWLPWMAWVTCSVTCGVGITRRERHCSLEGQCIGLRLGEKPCQGRYLDCFSSQIKYNPSEHFGAEWSPEEDKIIDDSFYFNEFLEMGLGVNDKYVKENQELLEDLTLDDWLIWFFDKPSEFVIGALIAVCLLWFYRIRSRRMKTIQKLKISADIYQRAVLKEKLSQLANNETLGNAETFDVGNDDRNHYL